MCHDRAVKYVELCITGVCVCVCVRVRVHIFVVGVVFVAPYAIFYSFLDILFSPIFIY